MDYLSTEGMIAGLLLVLELLDEEEEKRTQTRKFAEWDILGLETCPIRLSDGTYIYAVGENYYDPKDPHPYHAKIVRKICSRFGPDYEHLKGRSFDDLIEALLYLESVDLGEFTTTNDTEI